MPKLASGPTSSQKYSRRSNRFRCPHCPFIGCNKYSLENHIRYHRTRSSLQCSFCTFSVSRKIAMTRHMNRVHSEEQALKYYANKKKEKMHKKPSKDVIINSEAEKENNSDERGVYDELDIEEKAMKIEHDDPDDIPFRHMTKLIKAIASFSQVYQEEDNKGKSGDDKLPKNAPSVDPSTPSLDPKEETQKEEMLCHKELDQLAKDIHAYRIKIAQNSKEMKAETNLKVEKLSQRMQVLKITEQGLSIELAVLMEQKKRIQEDATVKTELKMKTDRKIFQLKFSSCSKVKQEASDGSSNEKRIKKRERLVAKLKKKLKKIGKEERDIDERIQTIEIKLKENEKNLVELRKDLESLRALSPLSSSSSIAVRIKTLKSEVCKQVNRFAYLEEHLVLLNAKHIIDDIRMKKKEWLKSYGCYADDNDDVA